MITFLFFDHTIIEAWWEPGWWIFQSGHLTWLPLA